jgi:hypothetical protein
VRGFSQGGNRGIEVAMLGPEQFELFPELLLGHASLYPLV